MKICDLALFSPTTSSGVKTYITNKIRFVESLGEDVEHTVVIPAARDYVEYHGRTKVCGVRGVRTFYPGVRVAVNIGRIADVVESEKPDLIEVNCQFTLPWAAFLATRRSRVPVIGIYHTDLPACARRFAGPSRMIGTAIEKLLEFYEGLIYRHFTLTIALTHHMIPRLNRIGIHRLQCLPGGVDIVTFAPEKYDQSVKDDLGLDPDSKVVLYAGRLSPEKEVSLLLDAFDQLPAEEYTLLIAGDGPDVSTVRNFAESRPSVRYLGHFDKPAELARIYAIADAVAVPSRYETFCMSAVEGLACGVPVVGIEGSGVASILDERTGALARAGDAQDFARKLAGVMAWPHRARTRSRCRTAAERYSWDRVLSGYFHIYKKLIAERSLG